MLPANAVERPKILGIAHVALYVKDLAKSRQFYEQFLGYAEPYTLPGKDGGVRIAFVKINDRQYVELFNELDRGQGQLNHVALATSDAAQMRDYLASQGIAVPVQVPKGRTGDKNFTIQDPDGNVIEIVEYQPDSWSGREAGKYLPESRISARIYHAGFLVGNLEKSMKFYAGVLGFREFWRGNSANSGTLSWVNMRVPDGQDYIEFMLYEQLPPPGDRGGKNHICLLVDDMQDAVAKLHDRPGYGREMKINSGVNRKRQCNLYDPDGTRIELMESNTIDGAPAPSSKLPPPH